MLSELEGRCSKELWREIGWKLLFYNLGLVGQSESYSSCMLMTLTSSTQGTL